MKWNEPTGLIHALEDTEDQQSGGRKKRLPYLLLSPIAFLILHAVLAKNHTLVTYSINFLIGLGLGAGIYFGGGSSVGLLHAITISKKGIHRASIGGVSSSEFWNWDIIGYGLIQEVSAGSKNLRLLIICSPEEENIGRIGLSESVSIDTLAEEFEKNGRALTFE